MKALLLDCVRNLSEIVHCVIQVEIEKGSLKGVSPISLIKSLTECCIKFSTYSRLKRLHIAKVF